MYRRLSMFFAGLVVSGAAFGIDIYAQPTPPPPGTIQLPPAPPPAPPTRIETIARDGGVNVGNGVIVGAGVVHSGNDNRNPGNTVPIVTVKVPTDGGKP